MQDKIESFFEKIVDAHQGFYDNPYGVKYFNGPTLYYHIESLNSRHCPVLFAKNSYAMLACWGMHRMGSKGPKMRDFEIYISSLQAIWPKICNLKSSSISKMTKNHWVDLEMCFRELKVMVGGSFLVGHSKVLAHLLPEITPPIDRTYTLKHLGISLQSAKTEKKQWEIYQNALQNFFLPIIQDDRFQKYLQCPSLQRHTWATSDLKCIDNLIIGAEKIKKKQELMMEKGKQKNEVAF